MRERVWDELQESGVARFPFPPHDRIPNFAGADKAADRLRESEAWREASVLKVNPDAPQLPVRRYALRDGMTVFVAVPRLREAECFYRLDPTAIDDVDAATTVSGIGEAGRQVGPTDVPTVDLVVSGSVAVSAAGDRIGKGEGYSDLEWGILAAVGAVDEGTVTATTVHERQVRDEEWTADDHDVPMDVVVTPDRLIRTGERQKPVGIDWDRIDAADRDAMPVLHRLSE